ncbi:hypothetical protein ACFL3T_03730 [Patescibacteria group bacterium]
MKNKIKIFAFAVLSTMLVNVSSALAADNLPLNVNAYALDTIAGYETQIYSSKTLSNYEVIFSVVKPDHTKLTIPVDSNNEGIAEFNLYDYHTKKAGEYLVSARLANGENSEYNKFYVYPDSVSNSKSTIEASKLVGSPNGLDKIYITVTLTDDHGNQIKGHSIEVISSRSNDIIQQISSDPYTNSSGSMIFAVSSPEQGISVYSFLDTTTSTVLDERLNIAYSSMTNVGGDISPAYAASGEVSYLAFENFPPAIEVNSDVSFELAAYDDDDFIVPNYAGTIHFSVEGGNSVYASVPNDYTFDIDLDSGSHTFSGINALNFAQSGTYTVVATDLSDFTVRGETEVTVGTGSTGDPDTPPTSFELEITSPTSGTYSQNNITVTGIAPSTDLNIQIFDNDSPLDTIEVDNDRTFSYDALDLLEGQHTMFVVALDSSDVIQFTSEEVIFEIDTTAPVVEDFYYEPETVNPGDIIKITVVSEDNVFQGAVVFNIDIAELDQDQNDLTKYTASIQAPSEPGSYSIDVILVDELGNEGSYTDVAIIDIGEVAVIEPPEEEPEEVEEVDLPPSDVFGLRSQGADGRVSLVWEAANDDNDVDHYKIYYGLSPAKLSVFVSTYDDRTAWYIPNLQNGNEYFFSIVAVDDQGQESQNMSTIISGIPFLPQTILADTDKDTDSLGTDIVPDKQAATGPEVLWFVVLSIFISQLYFKFKNKVS